MAEAKVSGKLMLKSNFAIKHKWEPFYTGGSIATCNKGNSLLCSCGDAVHVIDVETGAIRHTLSQDGDDVTCVSCSPDNTIIVSATKSLLLKQWKIDEIAECVRTWKAIHTAPILCMDFDATSTLLATGSSDSTIKVWDMVRQYCTHNLRGSQGVITALRFHPGDLKIFSASNDYAIRAWDLNTSRCICMLQGHVSAVTSFAFLSKNGQSHHSLVSSGRDSVLCMWDLNSIDEQTSAEPKKTIPVYENIERVKALSEDQISKLVPAWGGDISPHVVTAGSNGRLKVWNLENGKCVYSQKVSGTSDSKESAQESKVDSEQSILEILELEETGRFATVTFDHNINVFSLDEEFSLDKQLVGYNDEILDTKFFGKNDTHIIVAANSPLIRVFELKTSACQLLHGHSENVLCLDVFSDSMTFASGSKDNTIRIWQMDASTSNVTCVAIGRGHAQSVAAVVCSRTTESYIVSGSHDLTIKVWKLPEKYEDSPCNLKAIYSVKAHDKDINSVTISPNDKLIASGSQDKTAKLWSMDDGEQLGTLRGHKRGIWSVEFSPTDQILASSSADGTIKLWSLSDFLCLKTFEGHDCSVLKILFLSKGTQIISSGSNGLLKLWNVKSSECVNTFDGHDDKIWGLAVNSDDSIVLSGAADSKIIQWEDVTEKEKEEERQTQETTILRQQSLNNLIHEKKFTKAFVLAVTLEQPFTALKVLKEMRWQKDGDDLLEATIKKLRADQKDTLLKFVIPWNTNSRNCHEAQKVLNLIVKTTPPDELMSYSNAQTAVESLLPYTERHYQRMSKLMLQTTFVDFVWQQMKVKPIGIPESETEEKKPETGKNTDKHPLKIGVTSSVTRDSENSAEDSKMSEEEKSDEPSEDDAVEESPEPSPPKRMRLRSRKGKVADTAKAVEVS